MSLNDYLENQKHQVSQLEEYHRLEQFANQALDEYASAPQIEPGHEVTIAFYDLRIVDHHGEPRCEVGLPNGWPNDPQELDQFIKDNWAVGNQGMINNIESSDQIFSDLARGNFTIAQQFLVNWHHMQSSLTATKHVKLAKVDDLAPGTKYIYPIALHGSGHYNVDYCKKNGVWLPDRVKSDARRGVAKILIHEAFEGHGFNLNQHRKFVETNSQVHDIPLDAFGFVDGNLLTPLLQRQYGTRGFYYPWWEDHMNIRSNQQINWQLEGLYKKNTWRPHRFVCLNRRRRHHRILLTLAISQRWNSQTLWSLTDASQLQDFVHIVKTDIGVDDEKYINSIPKIIDVDETVNDTGCNLDIQYRAHMAIVPETMFIESETIFLSEKAFKPLMTAQPFIVAGSPYTLKMLQTMGYRTFHPIINEDYDSEFNWARRMQMIIDEIDRIAAMDKNQFEEFMFAAADICLHNHQTIVKRNLQMTALRTLLGQLAEWLQ